MSAPQEHHGPVSINPSCANSTLTISCFFLLEETKDQGNNVLCESAIRTAPREPPTTQNGSEGQHTGRPGPGPLLLSECMQFLPRCQSGRGGPGAHRLVLCSAQHVLLHVGLSDLSRAAPEVTAEGEWNIKHRTAASRGRLDVRPMGVKAKTAITLIILFSRKENESGK